MKNILDQQKLILLVGDPIKAKKELGWVPKYDLDSLVNEMVQADLIKLSN